MIGSSWQFLPPLDNWVPTKSGSSLWIQTGLTSAEDCTICMLFFGTVYTMLYDFTARSAPNARHITSYVNCQQTQTHSVSLQPDKSRHNEEQSHQHRAGWQRARFGHAASQTFISVTTSKTFKTCFRKYNKHRRHDSISTCTSFDNHETQSHVIKR